MDYLLQLTTTLYLTQHSTTTFFSCAHLAAMENDDFQKVTVQFLTWLSEVGVQMSPKMELVDLRMEGRGRGVGKYCVTSWGQLTGCLWILPS